VASTARCHSTARGLADVPVVRVHTTAPHTVAEVGAASASDAAVVTVGAGEGLRYGHGIEAESGDEDGQQGETTSEVLHDDLLWRVRQMAS
jgi:hypothetical protein